MTAAANSMTPDVLVLGGGGILGETWMSALLAGLDERPDFDARGCRQYVGTSAGSIVAASLVAGIVPSTRLGALPEPPPVLDAPAAAGARSAVTIAAELAGAVLAPLVPALLGSTAAGGALARRSILARIPVGRHSLDALAREIERAGGRWDERLRIAVVDLDSGRRVMLGASGAPQLSLSDAVLASCAIPGVFRPVRFEGRSYVDGGVWSPTNMDGADVQRGDRVLCLNPTGGFQPTFADPMTAIGPLSRMAAGAEKLALRRRGAQVLVVRPDAATLRVMGTNLMDPRPRAAVIAAAVAHGRRIAGGLDDGPLGRPERGDGRTGGAGRGRPGAGDALVGYCDRP